MEDLKLEDDEPMPSRKIGVGPLLNFLSNRQMGTLGRRVIKNQSVIEIASEPSSAPSALCEPPTSDEVAEERLIAKEPMSVLTCKLMGTHTRSTFLMVFSPDKELVASTHGDHNIYISEVKTGECIQTLKGHPRTPWCLAFHPSHVGLLASGCLGGHVRIWDLHGGSELWTIGTDNAINSLAFHPVERLLVVATMNELYFWDWSMAEPFCKVATRSLKEKVRYVKFDSMGHQLITGIANWPHGSFRNYNANHERHSFSQQQAAMARAQARRPYTTWGQNDTAGGAIYGRYFRGNILRPQPISANATATASASGNSVSVPPSTSSSASQTLSDLAAAASDQLMAENRAAIAAAAAEAADAAEAAAEAAAVLPRMRRLTEDPLLSDHPYGTQMARRPPPTTPNSLQQDPLLSDHPYGSPTGGRPPPTGLANAWDNDVWLYRPMRTIPPLEEIYQRERRVQQLLMTFRHSQDSSFVEVNRDGQPAGSSTPAGAAAAASAAGSMSSNELLSQIRERRMQRRNFARRQFLLDRIIKRRLETNGDNSASSSNTRPIDEWAINRRLALQQATNQDSYRPTRSNESSSQQAAQVSTDDNDDADSITAQFGDIPNPTPMEPDVTLRPMSTVDATILSRPSSSTAANDHNYTMSPGGTSSTSSATSPVGETSSTPQAEPQPSTSRGTSSGSMSSSAANIHHKYIALFNRQLKQMQRICKDSLADCAASRRRRQMVRLQSIENILEDLQKQIRSLRAASNEELQRIPPPSSSTATPPNNNNDESDEDDELETTAQLGLDERNYDERVGEGYHMRSLARSGRLTRALNRLSSEPQRPHHRNHSNLHRANDRLNSAHNQLVSHMRANNRLSRVHNQLVSQMRATYRAIEMSPDLNQRGKSPLANAKVKTSQEVMERTAKTAAVVNKGNSSTKQELCALSQRLERMLRERRESRNANSAQTDEATRPDQDMPLTPSVPPASSRDNGTTPRRDYVELNIPRPDPLPLDPRHRWRHMYDGSLQFPVHQPASGIFAESGAVDSSDSGTESDLDPQGLAAGGRGRDVHRSQRFLFPRRHSPRNLRWGGGAGGPLDQRYLHSRYGRHYLTASSTLPSSTLTSDPAGNMNEGPSSRLDIADLEAAERLPPLRELIWRRLRRRGASLRLEDDSETLRNSGQMAVRSHREGLSRMVDQMRIDQSTNTANGQPQAESSMTFSRSIPSVPIPPGSYWQGMNDPYNHGSFRSQYVNRIRTDDPPRMSMSRSFEPNTFSTTSHRIQAWNFAKGDIPDLTDSDSNIVVMDAKISNDASVDISDDGSLLVTLRPSDLPNTTAVGVYGLCESNKGRCFATYSLSDEYSQQPVSVSLSPTSKHLMVGYSGRIPCSRRTRLSPRSLMARIFQLKMPWECLINADHQQSPKGRLIRKRDLHQTEPVETSLNCIRWIPVAGLGMVYATDTGLLKILR